jgi:hypothetical protein
MFKNLKTLFAAALTLGVVGAATSCATPKSYTAVGVMAELATTITGQEITEERAEGFYIAKYDVYGVNVNFGAFESEEDLPSVLTYIQENFIPEYLVLVDDVQEDEGDYFCSYETDVEDVGVQFTSFNNEGALTVSIMTWNL